MIFSLSASVSRGLHPHQHGALGGARRGLLHPLRHQDGADPAGGRYSGRDEPKRRLRDSIAELYGRERQHEGCEYHSILYRCSGSNGMEKALEN